MGKKAKMRIYIMVFFRPAAVPPAGPPHKLGRGYWSNYARKLGVTRFARPVYTADVCHSIIDTDLESATAQP